MFTDKVSHRLSNGAEAWTDGLHMHIDVVCIVELWFRAKADLVLTALGNSIYCWPWREARKYLLHEKGKPGIRLVKDHKWDEWELTPPNQFIYDGAHRNVSSLNRIVAILVDGAKEFDILHWCLTTLGGSDD